MAVLGKGARGASDDIGGRLRRWRLRRGLSQRALAELAGFTQGYIGQIEIGMVRLDKPTSRAAIAAALQISVAELVGDRAAANLRRPAAVDRGIEALRTSLAMLTLPITEQPSANDLNEEARCSPAIDLAALGSLSHACRYDLLVPALTDSLIEARSRNGMPLTGA